MIDEMPHPIDEMLDREKVEYVESTDADLLTEAILSSSRPGNALIVVDVQNDFCPGGSLAVEHGDEIARRIHNYVVKHDDQYKVIVATKDYHPDRADFSHFSETPDYVDTWPPHCVQGTEGAEWHPNLRANSKLSYDQARVAGLNDVIEFDMVFFKGQKSAAYSGFEGNSYPSTQNFEDPLGWWLDDYLHDKGIVHVDVVGLATDYCVKATALDAFNRGFTTSVLLSMCAGVNPDSTEQALKEMREAGIELI